MNLRSSPSFTGRSVYPWIAAAAVVLKLYLVAAQPIVAIGGAGHDDRLFLQLAEHLVRGEWLGPYSQFTLMKGPMFSLFIATSFLAGVPLPLALHLLYLAGCVLLTRALRPVLGRGAALAVFLLLWWNPMTYEQVVLGRVLRQNFYTPVTLLFLAGGVALATRQAAPRAIRLAWGALLGGSAAALWLTREETVWIAPTAIVLVLAAGWISWRNGTRIRPLMAPLGLAALLGGGAIATVCGMNLRHYGWFGTVEFRAPEFLAAYGSLQRVQSSYTVRYVPVTREAREKLYAISPAFAELRPSLEGDIGRGWMITSSPWTGTPVAEREIAGGWFMWALRDAVVAAGHGQTARAALDFYGRIAAEVNAACEDGRVPALSRRDTMAPRWTRGHSTRLQRYLPEFVAYFTTFRGFTAYAARSEGDADLLMLFRDLTRWRVSPSAQAPELATPLQQQFDQPRLALLQGLGVVTCWIGTVTFYAGCAAWTYSGWRGLRRRDFDYLFWLGGAVLAGAAAVLAINLLVHVMSFPNLSPGTFSQGYPLLLLFGPLAITSAIAGRTSRATGQTPSS
jgi:hypothetical protein